MASRRRLPEVHRRGARNNKILEGGSGGDDPDESGTPRVSHLFGNRSSVVLNQLYGERRLFAVVSRSVLTTHERRSRRPKSCISETNTDSMKALNGKV